MSRKPKFDPAIHEENPEWTEKDFARAVYFDPPIRLGDIDPAEFEKLMRRGPQKTPTKVPVSIRLSQDVLNHFKSQGPGWQSRIDDALRKVAKLKAG